jgi:hypothetical protein
MFLVYLLDLKNYKEENSGDILEPVEIRTKKFAQKYVHIAREVLNA